MTNRMKDNLRLGMWILGIGGGIILPFLYMGIFVPLYHEFYVQPYCWEHGYKESRVTYLGKGYCLKKVDMTDVVVPMSEVK